jgi:hypothetical protein
MSTPQYFASLRSRRDRRGRHDESFSGSKCRLLNHVEFDLRDALSGHSQRFSGGTRDVNDASGHERTTVIDPNRHGAPSGDVRDTQARAERQRPVSGSQFARIEFFAARGLRVVAVIAGKSIRCILRPGRGLVARRCGRFFRGDRRMPVRDKYRCVPIGLRRCPSAGNRSGFVRNDRGLSAGRKRRRHQRGRQRPRSISNTDD